MVIFVSKFHFQFYLWYHLRRRGLPEHYVLSPRHRLFKIQAYLGRKKLVSQKIRYISFYALIHLFVLSKRGNTFTLASPPSRQVWCILISFHASGYCDSGRRVWTVCLDGVSGRRFVKYGSYDLASLRGPLTSATFRF